jgi:ABC-type polysaccharide/polyol phosphate transport system ATPase subunit
VSRTAPLAARGLGKRYSGAGVDSGVWALHEVSFEVPRGSSLAVVGENGSGKSTLLDLLMGATRPSEGQLEVEGPTASLLELGAGFFLELTGRENAVQMGLLAGLSRAAAREAAEAIGEFAELDDSYDRPVRTYSAGMSMRLGFAAAAWAQAPVTLIDEVLAVGDGYFQRKCIDRLRKMRGHTTLVVASHDLHALRGLCDRALWLRSGRVEALGAVDDVLGRYEEHLRRRAARADAPPGRHGTGEISIQEVRLKDGAGHESRVFGTGEALRVEVVFETRRPVDSPVMGVALFRDDGVYCYGPNTGFDGCVTGLLEGRYLLTAEFQDLPLLRGRYEVSVSFYDKDQVYAYAWDHRLYPFQVRTDRRDHGVVLLKHRFSVARVE